MKKCLVWAIGLSVSLTFFFSVADATTYDISIQGCVYKPDGSLLTEGADLPILKMPLRDGIGGSGVARTGFSGNIAEPGCYAIVRDVHFPAGPYVLQARPYVLGTVGIPVGNNNFPYQDISVEIPNEGTSIYDYHIPTPTKFISGVVTDTAGKPAANQHIWVTKLDVQGHTYWNNQVAAVMTNADGSYRVAIGNTAGSYQIAAEGDGINFLEGRTSDLSNTQTINFADDTTVEEANADFLLHRIVENTNVTGRMFDTTGSPTANAIVYANLQDDWSFGVYAYPNEKGFFQINLSPGTYVIHPQPRKYEPGTWVEYASYVVTVAEGESYSLGDIKPLTRNTGSGVLLSRTEGSVLLGQARSSTKNVLFVEPFATKKYFNKSQSSHVTWSSNKLEFAAATTIQSTNSKDVISGQAVSKVFTPKGMNVKTVLLETKSTGSVQSMLNFAVSADGKTWLTIYPGKTLVIPSGLNTKNGLRWRATRSANQSSKVTLTGIRVIYSGSMTSKKPSITSVHTTRNGSNTILTIDGKNFEKDTIVYLGTFSAKAKFKNAKQLTLTIDRAKFKNTTYTVSLLDPNLQVATISTKVNPYVIK